MNIVFDFGAVMVNWRPLEVVQRHFPQIATSPQAAAQLAQDCFAHPEWQEFDAGRHSPQSIARCTAERLGLDTKAMQGMVDAIEDHITPIATSVALLHRLHDMRLEKGYRLFFLSNMPVKYARGLERHDFMRCFEGGIFSGDVGLIKPQVEIFRLLETRHALDRKAILFIDDHPANIAAAQQEGWQTLHLTDPATLTSRLLAQLEAAAP